MGVGAAITAAIATAASTGYSIHQARQEKKAAKTAQKEQARIAEEKKQQAMTDRMQLIDSQREQLAGVLNGYNSNPTGQTGVRALAKKQNGETLG